MMIKLLVFDIDGVLTDGTVTVDIQGREQKKINLKDIDAIFELEKEGFLLAAITGEDTEIVSYFENRFPWKYFYRGNKHKKETLIELEEKTGVKREEICYIGDGKYDVEPLKYAGVGICPGDAIDQAKRSADIILQSDGGGGCLWELIGILKNLNQEELPEHYFYKRWEEHTDIFKKIISNQELISTVMEIAIETAKIQKEKGQIFLCGNGGSAADAQHIATEFVSRFYKERPAMNAEALSVNTSTLTAIGNDYSYERVFVRQLEAKGRSGDMLIGISTSGKSKNVLEAIRFARKQGMRTVMLMGEYYNQELQDICDYIVKIPSKVTPRIQEAHIFIGHLIAEYVEHELYQ
jgi:Phosphoheptose isomerase